MGLQQLRDQFPEFANDVKLNIASVIRDESGLNEAQKIGIALASAYAVKDRNLVYALLEDYHAELEGGMVEAAKLAASLMAMNNIYYRFVHLVSDKDYQTMPAKLRMNGMANPGVPKADFELLALAVSAINGCGLCLDSHVKSLEKEGGEQTGYSTCDPYRCSGE